MSFIITSNVSKSFNSVEILKNVSFTIQKGSITGLLGPNGSGKTTIIRILNGLIHPESGETSIKGMDSIRDGDAIRAISGIVTESTALYHEMSAYDNLKFFSELYGAEDSSRIDYLLEQFDMMEHKDKLIGTFSTGMKKRIALAKALLHKPDILFLDEPTNGLDPEGIAMVMKYLKKINQEENITILICTHVLHQLENICDAYLFINKGEIIESGNRRELERKYLRNIEVKVETGFVPSDPHTYEGFAYTNVDQNHLLFSLHSVDDISPLLEKILRHSYVHSCVIMNRDLESLYFAIRGDKNE